MLLAWGTNKQYILKIAKKSFPLDNPNELEIKEKSMESWIKLL